jgi:hypothetical protein
VAPLSPILNIRGPRDCGILADKDDDWNTGVPLHIGPHPALSDTQAMVIALDNAHDRWQVRDQG